MQKIDPNEIHVWHFRIDSSELEEEKAVRNLSLPERQRAMELAHFDLKRQFINSRYALRCILARYLLKRPDELEMDVQPGGKPVLSASMNSQLTFNLSHSGELGLCAVALNYDVGVDIERVREIRRFDEFIVRYMTPLEIQELEHCAKEDRLAKFFAFWTAKEAYLKGIGTGLRADLRVPVPADWTLQSLEVDAGYVAALAYQHPGVTITRFDWCSNV